MKTSDFIKNFIVNENKDIKSIDVLAESYQTYSDYLKLIQRDEVVYLFLFIKKYRCFWRGLAKTKVDINSYNYYCNKLEAKGFIKVTDPTENIQDDLKDFIGSYNFNKAVFYGLTEKGKHFLNLRAVKLYFDKLWEEMKDEL